MEAILEIDLYLIGPSGILVAKYVEGSIRVCEEMRPMPKVCPKHSLTKRCH